MVLKVNNLSKTIKQNRILNNVSFEINEGEIVTLLGPSGAGKTTTLRCISGLERCDSGDIVIKNRYLVKGNDETEPVHAKNDELKKIRKDIGLVFQHFNLFPHKSVLENIILSPIHVYGMKKESAIEKAIQILKSLGLEEKKDNFPYELSGGQKQRVAIARALILEPKIICFDEPTSALDPALSNEVANILKSLVKKGLSVLIITHDMEFAKISNRILMMRDGSIEKTLTPEEYFNL
ncbi:amino acid ABC transporter ATP-binding protein [Haloplasma contractile]|uniref:Arginine transport ATP-binding protein ArtM n=1 Tax=Haloplasma contractile SSD-17B TaxID=1033810 RepID=U2DRH1_9MOLU|nr:amino acid ABC transporter ATP-binding protein [Haloplasma contractile]ERJ11172.1 Arginine transport ATP-binding protein ArtM [Haloplasma contractile SSD-17B]